MKSLKKPRILFLITEDWYFCAHRLGLARAARDAGFEVHVATRVHNHGQKIKSEGFHLIPIKLLRSGREPIGELSAIMELIQIYRRLQPDIVHHVAIKPILYGSCVARLTKVPAVVNAFAGLGSAFVAGGYRAKLIRFAIQFCLRIALALPQARVLFENRDDCELMVSSGTVRETQKVIIRGSGVDITKFLPSPEPEGEIVVILASRMLWDKGVAEFIEASRLLKNKNVHAKFLLIGNVDPDNPTAISESQLLAWHNDGVIEWCGHQEQMQNVLSSAHIVVLPSYYREGIPMILLEAAACGRPIVTTDTPGCREIGRHGVNGLLVPPRDSQSLADAMKTLIENPALRVQMGICGREIAVAEFSAEKVIRETLAVYRELLGSRWPSHVSYPPPVKPVWPPQLRS